MANIIYISALDGFAEDFPLGIETWKRYADRIGVHLQVQTERDERVGKDVNGSWYPWHCQWLGAMDRDSKLLIVDADTMVRWNAPNIFEVATSSINVVKDSSPLNYGAIPHLNQWRKHFHVDMPPENYFNAGVMVIDNHQYWRLRSQLRSFFEYSQKHNTSSWEQTPLNILAWKEIGTGINYLPKIWNDMLGFNYEEGDTSYLNSSFVWHFTGNNYQLDKPKRQRLMREAYNKVAHNYEA